MELRTDSTTDDEVAGADVVLIEQVVLSNGIVEVTLSKPGGIITGVKYGGIDNLLEYNNAETNRGYWDMDWIPPGGKDTFYVYSPIPPFDENVFGTAYAVVDAPTNRNRVEVSFYRPYDVSVGTGVPLNIDKRFVLLRGHSGFYSYGIYTRPAGWPAFQLGQTRITFKLSNDKFHYMAIADDKQREMPSPQDLMPDRSQQLAYPEAHLLTNPVEPALKGQVDDKYQYSLNDRVLRVHGWVCADPLVGFWIITPSDEFRNGGPTKQNLTSHVGPTCLSMFHSAHYAGIELCPSFEEGEAWQKVFGPVFIYLNAATVGTPYSSLWQNAKAQVTTEMNAWPYYWPHSPAYLKAAQRGTLEGRLMVSDPLTPPYIWGGKHAILGLATPGAMGSWEVESKGYQFWTEADADGKFVISHIRAGVYDLYGWVEGVVGDYKFDNGTILISEGAVTSLGSITYSVLRDGPTVWEIGYPDRSAAGFYVPDPDPTYVNPLYVSSQKWRQYGLWDRYSELYPTEDLVFVVGKSDPAKDWFFAHLNRKSTDGSYVPTTWQVQFNLASVSTEGVYKLRIATAASHAAAIVLHVNDLNSSTPVFDTLQYGASNAIARHGIHGIYKLWNIDVPAALLVVGKNAFFLTQRKAGGPFSGVMYDYLRLEAPAKTSEGSASS